MSTCTLEYLLYHWTGKVVKTQLWYDWKRTSWWNRITFFLKQIISLNNASSYGKNWNVSPNLIPLQTCISTAISYLQPDSAMKSTKTWLKNRMKQLMASKTGLIRLPSDNLWYFIHNFNNITLLISLRFVKLAITMNTFRWTYGTHWTIKWTVIGGHHS